MALQLDWDDTWAMFASNPEMFPDDFWTTLPAFLQQKSPKVQYEIMKGCPKGQLNSLLSFLSYDCQIRLLQG